MKNALTDLFATIIAGIVVFTLMAGIIQWAWNSTVFEIFPGMVERGLIAKELTYNQSIKMLGLLCVVVGTVAEIVKMTWFDRKPLV